MYQYIDSPFGGIENYIPRYIFWHRYEKKVMLSIKCHCSDETSEKPLFCWAPRILPIYPASEIQDTRKYVNCDAVAVVILACNRTFKNINDY